MVLPHLILSLEIKRSAPSITMVHVATTLNGRNQHKMKILGGNYGSITKTQEGLAVFSEFITGSIDIKRMYRIMDRVKAIQMAIDGADFIEVFRSVSYTHLTLPTILLV